MELGENPIEFTLGVDRLVELLMMLNYVIREDQLPAAMLSGFSDQYDAEANPSLRKAFDSCKNRNTDHATV